MQFAQQSYSHLADLELADHPPEEEDLLIRMKTSLGWVLSGPLPHAPGSGSDVTLVTCHNLRLNTFGCDDLNVGPKDGDPLVEQVK